MAGKTSADWFSRIAVFGDDYGAPFLLDVIPKDRVAAVVCAQIRPQSQEPVRLAAERIGAEFIVQPKFGSAEYPSFIKAIANARVDSIFCYSYSMIVRKDILEMIGYRAVNTHGALLPKNRGPNSVQWALIRGESKTGATIHFMDDGIDSGDIIAQREVGIEFTDTWPVLARKVNKAAENLLRDETPRLLSGEYTRSPQDIAKATVNHRLNPDSPRIDFAAMDDIAVYNLIRAQVKPLAGAYVEKDGEKVRIPEFIPFSDIPKLRARLSEGVLPR